MILLYNVFMQKEVITRIIDKGQVIIESTIRYNYDVFQPELISVKEFEKTIDRLTEKVSLN